MSPLPAMTLSQKAVDFIDDARLETLLAPQGSADPVRVHDIIAKSLAKEPLAVEETAALLAATQPELVEEIFAAARQLKRDVYGNRIVLFAPVYVGNKCLNDCQYCGFKRSNTEAVRRTLDQDEIRKQIEALENLGHKRSILVFGEHPLYDADFIARCVQTVYETRVGRGEIRRVNINAAPMDHEGYRRIKAAGIGTYQIFQETYHHATYAAHHPAGTRKSDYLYRLDGVSRAIEAGCDDVGIGALFGLYDWRFEVLAMVAHARHLKDVYGCGPHTISFPRLRAASGVRLQTGHKVSDDDFKRLIAILRLSVPYTGLILTAREPPKVRRAVMEFGISQIDAGSRCEIGGYTEAGDAQRMDREQFVLGDVRPLDVVMRELMADGYVPSFCTSCYRKGRTGEQFMEFAIPGFIKQFCTPNALTTLTEYLVDYASPETRAAGEQIIAAELSKIADGPAKAAIVDRLERIREKGERDLYLKPGDRMASYRKEKDLLGEREVPAEALWGVYTERAIENFPLARRSVNAALVRAYGAVKLAAARTNHELGRWDDATAAAIERACAEMMEGLLDRHIVVDALQGGAGTSTNMNVNEVLANRTLQLLGRPLGDYQTLDPLGDINLHQSTNDTYPTALKVAAIQLLRVLERETTALLEEFQRQEKALAHVVKIGRTQMQDAVLTTLGREMSAYAEAFARDRWRIYKCEERLRVVNLGGTAIGTGLGAPRQYIFRVVDHLREITGLGLARAENLIDATQNADVFVEVSGILKACAVNLLKVSGDLRFLSSGPVGGIGEIRLPSRQAGSSIMPGKVNPVIPEAASQAAMVVMANDQAIAQAAAMGNLELNPFMPLIADALLGSLDLLAASCSMLRRFCVAGIEADEARCRSHVASTTAMLTDLVEEIGYEAAQDVDQAASREGKTIRQMVLERGLMTGEQFDALVSPERVTRLGSPPKSESGAE